MDSWATTTRRLGGHAHNTIRNTKVRAQVGMTCCCGLTCEIFFTLLITAATIFFLLYWLLIDGVRGSGMQAAYGGKRDKNKGSDSVKEGEQAHYT